MGLVCPHHGGSNTVFTLTRLARLGTAQRQHVPRGAVTALVYTAIIEGGAEACSRLKKGRVTSRDRMYLDRSWRLSIVCLCPRVRCCSPAPALLRAHCEGGDNRHNFAALGSNGGNQGRRLCC